MPYGCRVWRVLCIFTHISVTSVMIQMSKTRQIYKKKADVQNDMNKSQLVGALDGGCHFKGKLVRFGYIELAESIAIFYRQMKNKGT